MKDTKTCDDQWSVTIRTSEQHHSALVTQFTLRSTASATAKILYTLCHVLRTHTVCMRRRDVTETTVTTRAPFCGQNMALCVELNGEDLSCYSIGTCEASRFDSNSNRYSRFDSYSIRTQTADSQVPSIQIELNQFKKMSVWSPTYQQSEFKRCYSDKHFSEFYPQDGGKYQLA